jgi:PhnB protein
MEVKSSLTPMLTVNDGTAAVDFYKRAFGATEHGRVEGNGKIVFTEIRFNDIKFYLADESGDTGNVSPATAGGSTVRLELTVADPDSIAKQAVSCGARLIFPVVDHDYGYRQGRIEDPFGHQWLIGRPL